MVLSSNPPYNLLCFLSSFLFFHCSLFIFGKRWLLTIASLWTQSSLWRYRLMRFAASVGAMSYQPCFMIRASISQMRGSPLPRVHNAFLYEKDSPRTALTRLRRIAMLVVFCIHAWTSRSRRLHRRSRLSMTLNRDMFPPSSWISKNK